MMRAVRSLASVSPAAPAVWPRLSVVVPACNEVDALEPAMASLLAQDYPDLEIILVDDRSTDGTSELVDRIAARDSRVRAVHIRALPDGWLGKLHALHRGASEATGDWILFTDADVHFGSGVLRDAVALGVRDGLDHLCLVPSFESSSLLVGATVGTALRGVALSQQTWRLADPDADAALGAGAFNLVRRAAFEQTPGFEWLRLEVADDLGLAQMMKQNRGKVAALFAGELVRVTWYPSLGALVRGLEKNAFAQLARFSLIRGLLVAAALVAMALAPFAAFLPLGVPWLPFVGGAALLAGWINGAVIAIGARMSILPLLLSAPLGDLILALVLVRSSILGWRRGGLIWRGTVYPTASLREGMRVRF